MARLPLRSFKPLIWKSAVMWRSVTGEVERRRVSSQIPFKVWEDSMVDQSMVLVLLDGKAGLVSVRMMEIRSGLKTMWLRSQKQAL